jgi:hypothetical protein
MTLIVASRGGGWRRTADVVEPGAFGGKRAAEKAARLGESDARRSIAFTNVIIFDVGRHGASVVEGCQTRS